MSDAPPGDVPSTSPPSRYRRFQGIMDAAAGGSAADYDGYGRFWELPPDKLRSLVLYGVPMFRGPGDSDDVPASAAGDDGDPDGGEHACCHGDAAPRGPGRGARSGLVRGLRGEFPFDGSQFPPLPWGGTRVSDADVAFIEQWIDDGMPETDANDAHAAYVRTRDARAAGDEAHPHLVEPANAFLAGAGARKMRKNVKNLTADELGRYRHAIRQMKKLDGTPRDRRSYVYWAQIHGDQCQHGWEEFLTWHRAYLYSFELALQDIDPTITLPYWDWPQDAENVANSMEEMGSKTAVDNGYIPDAFHCWIDQPHIDALARTGKVSDDALNGLRTVVYDPATALPTFSSGPRLLKQAKIEYGKDPVSDDLIFSALEDINPLWHRLRWPGGNKTIIFEAYPTPDDITRVLAIESFFNFGSGPMEDQFYGALENIHNLMHNFSGGANPLPNGQPPFGDMTNNGTTAYDPIFWSHHANVDRVWRLWQEKHPNVGPDDPQAVLPPWNLTVDDVASTHTLGYDYAADTLIFQTDSSAAVQRFRSADVAVAPRVLEWHRRAEVRVHSVQHTTRAGFYVRAFLNTPDASAETPTKDNDRYVGQMAMFTGVCIGAPGHCDVPEPVTNRFDKRKRHPKTPSNFRFDATEAVRKLVAAGTTDFHVNLVVLNNDGTPAGDALRIDAVSLHFID
jgi:tyrosinase